MASKKKIADILFLDIETAGIVASFEDLSDEMQYLWIEKAKIIERDKSLGQIEAATLFEKRAGIYSEFARIVCISVGIFDYSKRKIKTFRTKSFMGDDEAKILGSFNSMLKKHFDKPNKQAICGHNIREFDIPFICRRMIVHGIKVPKMLDLKGKKPWQVEHLLDTMVLWRFGDYKNYTSLRLLAAILNIPTPKDDIDGSMIHDVYWNEHDLNRICTYCEKDVFTSAKVFLRLNHLEISENIDVISKT